MKVLCDREKLLAAFQIASVVAPARSPKPILRNVKFEVAGPVPGDSGGGGRGTLLATDLEVGVRVALADVQVEAPGSAVLPIDRVGLILRESSDSKLRIESDGQGTLVRGDRSEFKLSSGNPEEFPSIVDFTENKYHALPARVFKELIRRTVFATDTESSRYALGGVLFEMSGDKITAVGTDGRRLAMMEAPGKAVEGHETGDTMTIVPTKALHFIERALIDGDEEVQIATRANDVLVRSPRVTIYSRLVEGRFPKWRDVFPRRSDAVKIEMVVGPLHSAVRQAAIVTNEESRGVDFVFGDGKVVLSGRGAETGQSRVELPIAYDGASIGITLDPRYVNDFLKVLDADKNFTLEIKDSESAAVCSTDDGYGYVIMPLARDRR